MQRQNRQKTQKKEVILKGAASFFVGDLSYIIFVGALLSEVLAKYLAFLELFA